VRRWERWTFNVLALVVAVTGFAYLWMKYVAITDDPFAVVNHPWQPAMLNLHVLASPIFLLMFGIILNSHVMKKLRTSSGPNRKTGLTSLATFAGMVGSGYLLQVTSNESALQALVVLHAGSGTAFTIVYAIHLVASARLGRARARSPIREVA
jgi:hypothetical protein